MNPSKIDMRKTTRCPRVRHRKQTIFLIVMMAIPLLQWSVFWLYVNFNSILLAFQSPSTGAWSNENFITFWESLTSPYGEIGVAIRNTFIYFGANILIIIPLSLAISYFIYKKVAFYKGFRILFYLPSVISAVAMVKSYENFIDPAGVVGWFMRWIGNPLAPEGLLANPATATWTIVFYYIWTGFGVNTILFSSVMSRIPTEVIESAKLEGCGPFRELAQIIFPLIWPTVATMIILACTAIFSSSGPILLFTDGGHKTATLDFWIFKQVYGTGVYGGTGAYNLVSCTGLCFTLVGVPLIMIVRWLTEKIPAVEY